MSAGEDKTGGDKRKFAPTHPHGHEDRTGIGFGPKAFEHTQSRGNITDKNAYDLKTAVSSSTPTHAWPISGAQGSTFRNYEVNVQGQPYTVRTSDVTGSEKINTAFPGISQRKPKQK